MADAGSSKTPDMAKAFMDAALENRKAAMEDEVFHQILRYWEELQGLHVMPKFSTRITHTFI